MLDLLKGFRYNNRMNKNKWLRLQAGESIDAVCGPGTSPRNEWNPNGNTWKPSVIQKFKSISPGCKTAQRILKQFYNEAWLPYKAYNAQWAQWEYLVLLKLVACQVLKVRLVGNGKKYPHMEFKNVNRFSPAFLEHKLGVEG